MSQENVEVVRDAFESFATLGLAGVADRYWDPQVEYVEDPLFPGASSYRGRDEVLACFEGYLEALGGEGRWRVTVEDIVDSGSRQVAFVRLTSGGSASGVPSEHLWAYVAEVKDERVTYLRAYYNPNEALEALGLSEQAMSRENEQLVQSAFDAWNRDDLEAQLEMIHPEIEYVPSGLFPGLAPIYRGHSGYKDFWRDFKQTWESLRIEIDDLREVEVGEQYVVLFTFEGRARDGLTVRRQFGNVVSVRDRLAVRIEAFGSWAEALEAVGLSE